MARILGIAPEQTLTSLPRLLSGIDFEDRARVESHFHAADGSTGLFEIEFRTSPDGQTPSWLRLMGSVGAHRGNTATHMRGLAFDLTERRLTRGSPAQQAQHRINQLADHAITMKCLLAEFDNPPLTKLFDKVAVEIGLELARRLSHSDPAKRH